MDANKKKPKDAPATTAGSETPVKRLPVKSFCLEDVSASVWTREYPVQGETRTFYSVTLERSYKDRDGAYRYTKSFDSDNLGKLMTVIQQAHEFIGTRQQDAA